MVTIKGPLTFKQGTKDLAKFILKKTKIHVPFAATGWKSTKGMELLPDKYKEKGDISIIKIEPKKLTDKEIENVVYKEKSVVMEEDKPKRKRIVKVPKRPKGKRKTVKGSKK